MKLSIRKISFIIAALILAGCTKPYKPPAIKAVTGYLVVEGLINAGDHSSSTFKLTRTVNLDSTTVAPVTGAQVSIEANNNTSYALTEDSAGVYTSAPQNLSTSQQYRLSIITSGGEQYLSDYIPVKVTPPIDTVNYLLKSGGVQITLNSHDPANATRYYRWDYSETWEFHSEYDSEYISNGDSVIVRQPDQQIYYCFNTDSATSILLGSSAKLVQDVISTAPITFVPATSEKLEREYSIIVHQYALTTDGYNFWQNLKKNTEQLGSIFDALPSQINGNIHSTSNPAEPVIGYISASTVQSKRIFIDCTTLPVVVPVTPYTCEFDSVFLAKVIDGVTYNQENQFFNYNKGAVYNGYIPINAIAVGRVIIGHTGAIRYCVDCTVRGPKAFPSFWPYNYY